MDEDYDVIICGTGLKECVMGALLSLDGKKVLQVDRNNFYGTAGASLNLTHFYKEFRPNEEIPVEFSSLNYWNIDLIPKFVMSSGLLVKILLKTDVTKYLEWKSVDGTYVYNHQKAGFFSSEKFIHKVPATDKEAMGSPLMDIMQKYNCAKFLKYCAGWDPDDKKTWNQYDTDELTMKEMYDKFGLGEVAQDFIGHAIALYINDSYKDESATKSLKKLRLYIYSLTRYGNSPFIYPLYGLGNLPEGFSRLSALHGGTFMLNTAVDGFEYDSNGKVCGVRFANQTVTKCKSVICDTSYAQPHKVRSKGKVIRSICFLDHRIREAEKDSSCQIIIPQKAVNRYNDIYITMLGSEHGVVPQNIYLAICSTTVESETPEAELQPAFDLLKPILKTFTRIYDYNVPCDDGRGDNVFVTPDFDATSHFESTASDIMEMYKNYFGHELDLTIANN